MKKIAYYITAHGYGHGARASDILNALHTAAPETPIIVKTDLPEAFMHSRIPASIELRSGAFDVGLIQKDSIRVDLDASLAALEQLYARETELIQQEIEFLRAENVGVVVADVPAIPLAAAQQLGLPNIATSNFGWDWIYADFIAENPRWVFFVEKFRTVYQQTDLLLRQPFSEPMEAFPRKIDLSLLAKPGINRRALVAEVSGADLEKKWVLLSFTSLLLEPSALEALAALSDYEFFAVEPLEWPGSTVHTIARSTVCFADVMASVDVVVTKPGFGIVSESIANGKPIIYSDRAHFREYPVLVDCIQRYCRQAFVSNQELYAGHLGRALKAIESAPPPREQIEPGGAELAAQQILRSIKQG
jgi:L-arabinokinase